MQVIRTPDEMHAACAQLRRGGKSIGLVPTMGALHEGHLSLVRIARAQSDVVAVSLFVNPLQFGPNEDFASYPRTFERDRQLLEAEHADLLFAPMPNDMYPPGGTTYVVVEGLSVKLCGRSRPTHFRGVTTVVAKLFHIVEPDLAVFGQKDAAQVAVIKRMVRDLNLGVRIVVAPIIREPDGLAMSSRNAYLDPQQRRSATVLHRALTRIESVAAEGERRCETLISAGQQVVAQEPGVRLDYLEIVDPDTLEPLQDISQDALVAIAAFVGSTRLIDNIVLRGA